MKTHLDQKALPAESTWRHKHLEDQNLRTTKRLLSRWYGWTTPPDPGIGSHVGIVLALAVHLLPSLRQSGTHLGVLHAAIFVALILSPQIGSFILTTFAGGFAALFLVVCANSLLAGGTLLGVTSGRREVKGSQTVSQVARN